MADIKLEVSEVSETGDRDGSAHGENPQQQAAMQMIQHNPYLVFQSGVEVSIKQIEEGFARICTEPPKSAHIHTLAPKREPPPQKTPPNDGCADDKKWHYSWRLVVRVGSAPGEWPMHRALELAKETFESGIYTPPYDEDVDLFQNWERHTQVIVMLLQQFDNLLAPCSAETELWAQLQRAYLFQRINGEFRGHNEIESDETEATG